MTIKSIVCLHHGFDFERSSLATAIELAKANRGHLRIIHPAYLARPYAGFYGEAVAIGWQDALENTLAQQIETAASAAAAACEKFGLPLSDDAAGPLPRASFLALSNYTNRSLARDISLADILVTGAQAGTTEFGDSAVNEVALFSTGRPVLVVRPGADGAAVPLVGVPCGIAWNDSPEAVNALVRGRPLYAQASAVHLFCGRDGSDEAPPDHQRLALDYLRSHGMEASVEFVTKHGEAAADDILARATQRGCAYLGMGAYGHSVFREMVLGGFTRHMLQHAEMSLLLSH